MIVLISGKQGAGKTTLGKALVRAINNGTGIYAHNMTFAEPLYRMHDFCWGLLKDHGIEMPFKKDGYLLQLLGTEWGRERVDNNLWVKLMRAEIEKAKGRWPHQERIFVISDCRFKNEANEFPEALKVRLECDEYIRRERAEMWRETQDHPSETDLDDFKFDLTLHTNALSVEECLGEVLTKVKEVLCDKFTSKNFQVPPSPMG
jgi:AAA domain